MATIDNTSIYQDIIKIASLPALDTHYRYEAEFWIGDEKVPAIKVISLDRERNYSQDHSDVIMLRVAVGLGTYTHRIYPFKQSLTVKLYQKEVIPAGGGKDLDSKPIVSEDYEAILVDAVSPTLVNATQASDDVETGDRSDILTIDLQLIEKAANRQRGIEVGGVFRNTTVQKVIKLLFSAEIETDKPPILPFTSKEYEDDVLREAVLGCDIVDCDNTTVYDHIVIPHGTRLVDVPLYLQRVYGVYNTGIGYYYQHGIWFVYPLFNPMRFNDETNHLIIANVPANRMPGIEKSYRVEEPIYYGKTFIIATGDVAHQDTSETLQLNQGNGYVMGRSSGMLDRFSETSANVVKVKEDDTTLEGLVESRSGHNFIRTAKEGISDNSFLQNSRLAKQVGALVQLRWDNSKAKILYPGMPLRLLYVKGGEVASLNGCVFQVEEKSSVVESSPSEHRHARNAAITVFIQRDKMD